MPFGHKAGPTRVYEYGCRAPLEGEALALEQMRGRVRLWNRLVEIEGRYQEQYTPYVAGVCADANIPYGEARAALPKPEQDAAVAQQRALLKQDIHKAVLTPLELERRAAVKAAYQEYSAAGLYWGNVNDVISGYDTARKQHWGQLGFQSMRRAMDSQHVAVQLQRGLAVADAFGEDTRLRLAPVPEDAWTAARRGDRRRKARSTVHIRIGSEGRAHAPVWLVLPVVLHRPLPPEGRIKWATVQRKRVGTRFRWKLLITVEFPAPGGEAPPVTVKRPTLALDVGYRRLPECGLRVAVWHDAGSGQTGEVQLSEGWLREMGKTEDIRSIRDRNFNAAVAGLRAWLAQRRAGAGAGAGLPEWLREATVALHQWRSPARLAGLALRWRNNRFDDDADAYGALEAWRQRDKHLYEYEANLRDQLLRRRREQYRIFAAWVAAHYGTVQIEDFDLREVAERHTERGKAQRTASVEKGVPVQQQDAANHYRQWAAVSRFRLALQNACQRAGVAVVKRAAAYTTLTCHACGTVEEFNPARELRHRCSVCGMLWDQDVNAAKNLMGAGERHDGGQSANLMPVT